MMDTVEIMAETQSSIERLKFDDGRPLIICDADEVLVEFAKPLERFLLSQGMRLYLHSFALSGNIRRLDNDEIVPDGELNAIIHDFMEEVVDAPTLVGGASEAFATLQSNANLVVLTNVPHHLRERRARALDALGIHAPVISNSGEKGPAVAALLRKAKAASAAVFIDDLPPHHSSVARHASHVHRIHFVADQRLAKLIEPASESHHRIDCWLECLRHLKVHLKQTGN